MEISFLDTRLKKLCEDPKSANRKFGAASAKKLRTRLADLRAAEKLGDIKTGQPHPLKNNLRGKFVIYLSKGQHLVFESSEDPPPLDVNGNLEWEKVRSIRIVLIGDYHD